MARFEPIIHTAMLADFTDPREDVPGGAYCTERLYGWSEEQQEALRDRVAALGFEPRARVGLAELEIVDFVLSRRPHRILTVVGGIGIGKTSLMRYVFEYLPKTSSGLDHILALLIDLRSSGYGTWSPDLVDLASLISSSAAVLRARVGPAASNAEPWIVKMEAKLQTAASGKLPARATRNAVRSALVQFASLAKQKSYTGAPFLPVIVADNLDHLSDTAASKVLDLLRSVENETECTTILTTRPPTMSVGLEQSRGRGAFISYTMQLPPCDLRYFVRRRLEVTASEVGLAEKAQEGSAYMRGRVRFFDHKRSLLRICQSLLRREVQELLSGFSNANLRDGLLLVDTYLRSHALPVDLAVHAALSARWQPWTRNAKNVALTCMMLGDALCFEGSWLIPNLYATELTANRVDYIVFYYVLSLLEWIGHPILRTTVTSILTPLPLKAECLEQALDNACRASAAYSPEWTDPGGYIGSVGITSKGSFLLEKILPNPTYHYHMITDTPLDKTIPEMHRALSFPARIEQLLALLDEVLLADEEMIEGAVGDRATTALAMILRMGTAAKALYQPVSRLLSQGKKSEIAIVRNAATHSRDSLTSLRQRIDALERTVKTKLDVSDTVSPQYKRLYEPIEPSGQLILDVPDRFVRGRADDVSLAVEGLERQTRPGSLSVVCTSGSKDAVPLFPATFLSRLGANGTYTGAVRFALARGTVDFPTLEFSFVADGQLVGVIRLEKEAGASE